MVSSEEALILARNLVSRLLEHVGPQCCECGNPATRIGFPRSVIDGEITIGPGEFLCEHHLFPREGVQVDYDPLPTAGLILEAKAFVRGAR